LKPIQRNFIQCRNSEGTQTYIPLPFPGKRIARARVLGKKIGVKFAEGFISEKKIGIKNLDALIQHET